MTTYTKNMLTLYMHHQEFDRRVVLIPYESILRSMCPSLQQWHRRWNIESLYPCG